MERQSEVKLIRLDSSDHGTFGKLVFEDSSWLYSGELPDRYNLPNFSCIPTGLYECEWTYSPAFKRWMYLVTNVPKRSGIRFHVANFMGDANKRLLCQLNGCIALGEKLGKMNGQKGVFVSSFAISTFERKMNKQPFTLTITGP